MSQQINLFNPIFRQEKKYFSAVTMLQAILLIGVGGLCLSAYLNQRVAASAQLAESGQLQLAAREAQLAKVNQQFAPRQSSKELAVEIAATAAEVKALQEATDVLQHGAAGNARGYSAYLAGFARQTVSGLWLTGVTISGAGNDIGIEGRTLRAELVPQLIRRLASEPVFQGKSFGSLEISQASAAAIDAGKPGAPAFLSFKLQAAGASPQEVPGRVLK